ncbi:hypothetical protein ACFO5R_12755 [Halosolutus amylolyticus]|uniref:Small CPxCG-related zinc finger protein n=1 Tax=Halosolutus amylolyticus TaxID=2932267 RepID=A0ABD5PQB5_9EURY|nr:hypothetical protein [Halosolutus amylolyticus]
MQTTATRAVECPQCAERTRVSIPDEDADLKVSHSVAAYGEQTAVSCSNGHRYWVVVC